jgi:serine protein kinase
MPMENRYTLDRYVRELSEGKHHFENAFQSVKRMILGDGSADYVEKVTVLGRPTYDFKIFRKNQKPIVGMHEVINSFVSYVKDAAEGGSSNEMAFVLVGEPANGKTFFIDYLSKSYRDFLAVPENSRYTFAADLGKLKEAGLKSYGSISTLESQTYEDPMILAMNLCEDKEDNVKYMHKMGFSDKQIESFYAKYRPLGACTDYMMKQIREIAGNKPEEILKFINVVPVKLSETMGTLTGKYPAKDKMTSSASDLVGKESIQRLLHLTDTNNPYVIDLRKGALARVAGGGIHFSDEIFKNKQDLVQVYLGVIQNRMIEINGHKWPIDSLIVATSNIAEFNTFASDHGQAPIVDRCRICYMPHVTNYREQIPLTAYVLAKEMTTFSDEVMHLDPNLKIAASIAAVLTRLPVSNKLSRIDMLKLCAGEVAGDKSMQTLVEIVEECNRNPDVSKRFGHSGLGQRNIGRTIQRQRETSASNEGRCLFAGDIFEAYEREILDTVKENKEREKSLEDLKVAKSLYRKEIRTSLFNAYMNDNKAIEKDVLNYINMIIGLCADNLGPDKIWTYRERASDEVKSLKIDEKFVNAVEERLGLKTQERKNEFRDQVRKIYLQKTAMNPNYCFTDNIELIEAVTNVRLESDINGAGSLVGALANRTNEENQQLYKRILTAMTQQGYCKTCAIKTIEEFCKPEPAGK